MTTPINILLLEDDPADAKLIQDKIQASDLACRITRVQTRNEFSEALLRDKVDIILANLRLDSFDGMSALQLAQKLLPEIPFIFVSGTLGEEAAIEALTSGATDYVLKNNLSRLAPAVRRALQEARNRRERRRAERALLKSESKMRSILDTIGIGVSLISPKMEILELNQRMRQWFPDIDPKQRPICYQAFNTPARREVCSYCPTCKTLKDGLVHEATTQTPQGGEIRNYRIISTPLFNEAGKVVAAIEMVDDITEQLQAKESLQRSNEILRAIIEAAPVAIVGLDLDGHVHSVWNPAAEKMLGWRAQDVMGRPLPSVPAERQEEFSGFREKIRRGMTLDGVEVRRQRRDGSPIDYSIYASPLHDPQGRISGNIAVMVDITERKKAERERLVNLRLFESLDKINHAIQKSDDLEHMMGAVLDATLSIFDCDRVFFAYPCDPESRAWTCPMEISKPEYSGVWDSKLEIPIDPQVAEMFRIILDSDRPVKFGPGTDHQLLPDTFKCFRVQSFMSMALLPKVGKPWQFGIQQCSRGCVWTAEEERLLQEIGRRLEDGLTGMLAYRDLKESEARYRQIVDTANEGIWVVGPDALTTFVNARMAEMLGYSIEEMIGRSATDFMCEEDALDHERKMENRRQGKQEDYERRFRHRDGREVWAHASATPLFDAEHRFNGSFAMFNDITEKKRAESRLNEQLHFLQQLIDSIPLPVYYKDSKGLYLGCNSAFEAFTGLQRRDIVGKTVHKVIPKERADIHHEADLELLAHPGVQSYEISGVYQDAKHHDVVFNKATFVDANDCVAGTVGTLVDITERKQAERERLENLSFLDNIVEHIPNMIFVKDAQALRFVRFNKAGEQLLGYSREELIGKADRDFFPKEEADFFTAMDRQVLDSKQLVDIPEETIRTRSNEERILHTKKIPILDENGVPQYLLGISEDITERKQAEESIRKLSQAVEQSPVSIVITDVKGRIEFVNAKFTQITGYTFAEALGQNPRILKFGETPAEEYERLWKTISSGGVWQGEFHNRKKNGNLFWEQAIIAPIRNENEVITHYVAVKEDITARKKLEEQLRHTQKMEAVGQLAGGVAHDFNNMLSVIIGYAQVVLDEPSLNHSMRENLQEILAAAFRSADITRQLLAFARKQTIVPKVLELNKIVEGMLKLLRRLIGEDIDLVWMPGSNVWPVKMDPSQIDQILANLCINARDAISGVGKVTIETQRAVFDKVYCAEHEGFSPGEFVMLAVSDNGSGMDKRTMDKIFEPFFTTKELGKGTGLGLATVYGIVKQNAGFINVYSEPEHGSTFKIYLPRYAFDTEHAREERPAPAPHGHETILLVEDESALLSMVTLMLERFGYTVLASSTPKEAIHIANENPGDIDLLITDLVMPEMTGRELAETLASLCPQLKCLFMSGYSGNVIAHQRVLEEGVCFIQKPFSNQELASKVREALDRK